MLVKKWMSTPVITIEADSYLQEAADLMKTHNIRGLPVIRNEKLEGYINDIDVKRAAVSEFTTLEHISEFRFMISNIKVKAFMRENPVKIPFNYTVDKAAEIMLENRVSSSPVVDGTGQLVGVITQTDIFRLLVSFIGVKQGGIQFGLMLEDRAGSIREPVDVMRKYGGRVSSILSACEGVPEGYRKVYVRVYNIEDSKLHELKQELVEKEVLVYMVYSSEKGIELYEA